MQSHQSVWVTVNSKGSRQGETILDVGHLRLLSPVLELAGRAELIALSRPLPGLQLLRLFHFETPFARLL